MTWKSLFLPAADSASSRTVDIREHLSDTIKPHPLWRRGKLCRTGRF
jgi:hypothetical protein